MTEKLYISNESKRIDVTDMSLQDLWNIRNMDQNKGYIKALFTKIVEKLLEMEKEKNETSKSKATKKKA
jgi:hypothetical protein